MSHSFRCTASGVCGTNPLLRRLHLSTRSPGTGLPTPYRHSQHRLPHLFTHSAVAIPMPVAPTRCYRLRARGAPSFKPNEKERC